MAKNMSHQGRIRIIQSASVRCCIRMRLALELGDHGLSSFPNLFINYTKVDIYDEEISICSIV